MKNEMGKVSPLEKDVLDAAIKAVNAAHSRPSVIEKNRKHERSSAVSADCQNLRERMLAVAGIDQIGIEQCSERNANEMRAFFNKKKQLFIDQSNIVAQQYDQLNRQSQGILSHLGIFAKPQLLVTLDAADAIVLNPPVSQRSDDFEIDIKSDPPASNHNFIKAYMYSDTPFHPGPRFCIPGYAEFTGDFYFHWTANVDVYVNMVTFVQPNGTYYVNSGWDPFFSNKECVTYSSSLRYFIPPPNFDLHQNSEGYLISNLANTASQTSDQYDYCTEAGPFDFSGTFKYGYLNDQSTLFDNSQFYLPAGYTLIFVVGVKGSFLQMGCQPSFQEIDFYKGDFGINVPGVFLGVFPVSPIP